MKFQNEFRLCVWKLGALPTWAQIMKCTCVSGVKIKEEMLPKYFVKFCFNSICCQLEVMEGNLFHSLGIAKVEVLMLTCFA